MGHPVSPIRLTEQLRVPEAWNSGLERTAGALGSAMETRKEPGERRVWARLATLWWVWTGGPRRASPCALFRLWSRRGQAGGLVPALWFRAQPSEWFHRPRPVSKSVTVW